MVDYAEPIFGVQNRKNSVTSSERALFRYACLFISINSERQHFGVEYRFGEGRL